MDQFRGDGFLPTVGMGRGRGNGSGRARGRGRGPEDDGGQGQALVSGVGRGTGTSRAYLSYPVMVPEMTTSGNMSNASSSSSEPVAHSPLKQPSTWENIDDLPRERLRRYFGDVEEEAGSSSGGLEMVKRTKNEYVVKPKKAKQVKERKAYLPEGFLDPMNITLSYLSDTIKPGEEHYCALYTMISTSDVYLIFSQHFSKAVDGYIAGMGRFYMDMVGRVKLLKLNVRDEQLVAGAIVVVYHKEMREWKRAKIVESFRGARGQMYKVLFLDLGDLEDVYSLDIVYMHESCLEKPVFAIKATLQLSPFYNCSRYRYNPNWDKTVCHKILDSVQNKKVLVKFIEQENYMNQKSWVVSLLSVKDRPGFGETPGPSSQNFSEDQPIEQQVIAKMMDGQYFK